MDLAAAAAVGNRVTWTPSHDLDSKSDLSDKSIAGRLEQRADAGRSDFELRGLNDYASTGSGPTRQSDARDSEPLPVSVDVARAGYCSDHPLLSFYLSSAV